MFGLTVLLLAGCDNPVRKVSESSFRNATARGAAGELRGLGYRLRKGLTCRTLSDDTLSVVRVVCTGMASDLAPVRVEAVGYAADTATPRQDFLITVGGREVLRMPCLDQGCRKDTE